MYIYTERERERRKEKERERTPASLNVECTAITFTIGIYLEKKCSEVVLFLYSCLSGAVQNESVVYYF
jgi:hypothetical protein